MLLLLITIINQTFWIQYCSTSYTKNVVLSAKLQCMYWTMPLLANDSFFYTLYIATCNLKSTATYTPRTLLHLFISHLFTIMYPPTYSFCYVITSDYVTLKCDLSLFNTRINVSFCFCFHEYWVCTLSAQLSWRRAHDYRLTI